MKKDNLKELAKDYLKLAEKTTEVSNLPERPKPQTAWEDLKLGDICEHLFTKEKVLVIGFGKKDGIETILVRRKDFSEKVIGVFEIEKIS